MASRKSDLKRTELQKEKTGVFTGCYARNPVNGEAIPIWVADYVLGSYGTGAIMAVPAHDARDQEFALNYKLPIYEVVKPGNGSFSYLEKAYTGEGTIVNSSSSTSGLNINGLNSKDAASRVIEWLEKTGNGMKKVTLFSLYGNVIGESLSQSFSRTIQVKLNLYPKLSYLLPFPSWMILLLLERGNHHSQRLSLGTARRETNTMPQWAGSCWYYLRFMDPSNSQALVDKEKEKNAIILEQLPDPAFMFVLLSTQEMERCKYLLIGDVRLILRCLYCMRNVKMLTLELWDNYKKFQNLYDWIFRNFGMYVLRINA